MSEAIAQPRKSAIAVLLVASIVMSLCMGLRQTLGLYLPSMAASVQISAAMFGLAMAVQNLTWGLAQPVVGAIADRYGARPVLVASSVIFALGLLMMGIPSHPLLGLQVGGGVLVGLGTSGAAFGVLLGAVMRATPPERQSRAVGIVSAAGSLGTFIIAPVGQALIDHSGWRIALLWYVAFAGVMALISFGIGGQRQNASASATSDFEQTTRQAIAEAIGHRGFLAMTVAFFACGFQLIFITTHLPRFIALCGISPSIGAWSLALIGLFNAIGCYVAGLLGTRYDRSKLLATFYAIRTLTIAVYIALPISPSSTLIFAAVMGSVWLGVAPLVSGLIGGMFGLRHFNTIFGVAFLSHQVGAFAGAYVGGAVFDVTGSYTYAWLGLLVIGALASVLQWPMDHRPVARLAKA